MSEEIFPLDTDTVQVNGVIFTYADIHSVVKDFYTQIQFDPQLEVPFRSVHDWPEHIKRLTHFWWIRFGGRPYLMANYDPVTKHFFAGFNNELLVRWLSFFHATIKKNLSERQYALWAMVSERMGQGLSARNEILRREHESK